MFALDRRRRPSSTRCWVSSDQVETWQVRRPPVSGRLLRRAIRVLNEVFTVSALDQKPIAAKMAAVASIVGAEDTRPHERSHPVSAQTARRWVTFSFGLPAAPRRPPPADEDDPPLGSLSTRGRARHPGRHAAAPSSRALTPGCLVGRRENESVRPPCGRRDVVAGRRRAQTFERRRGDQRVDHRPGRAAPGGSRWSFCFPTRPRTGTCPARVAARPTSAGAALSSASVPASWAACSAVCTGRARCPRLQWDYLAYLEMQPQDVAHVREHLAELRDVKRNPAAQPGRARGRALAHQAGRRLEPGSRVRLARNPVSDHLSRG